MYKKDGFKIPMRLQFFAEGGDGTGSSGGAGDSSAGADGGQGANGPEIDYDKIQKMLDGTLAAKEDTALKAYFKQQGLSQEEAEQAMSAFKQQKAANQPDVLALQQQARAAQAAAQQAQLESAATMAAVALGIDAKTIPYVLKMADTSQVIGQDGKINDESLKNALNKVLEDVPALKPQAAGGTGFFQMGATSGGQTQQQALDTELDRIFGVGEK